jgi:uncharacterized protein YukE
MVDLDFERRMNPWLFDSSGNLTDAAKKQFPDLVAAASGSQEPGWAPNGPSTVVSVNPDALVAAGRAASSLQASVTSECRQPLADFFGARGDLSNHWQLFGALDSAWGTWDAQVKGLVDALGAIAQNLQDNAHNYANGEQQNQRRLQGI